MIILSFGGADEVSKGRPSCFQLLDTKDLIFEEWGSSLYASIPRGSSLIDERLNPLHSKPGKCSDWQQFLCELNSKIIMLASNKLLSTPKDCLELPRVFFYLETPQNSIFLAQIVLVLSTQVHIISNLYFHPKLSFLVWIFPLFSFSFSF